MQLPPVRIYALILVKRQIQPCKFRNRPPAAQTGQTARKTGRENSTQIRPLETIRSRPQTGSVYNHDTAVNTSRQSLLLITQKKLELISKAKTVKCTMNQIKAVKRQI